MKPHTATEKQITTLSNSLAPITQEVNFWAEKNIFLKWGVLSRGRFHCLDCGNSWKPDSIKQSTKFTKCEACLGKLKMHGCNQVHFREIEYSAVVTCTSEFQVVRIICSHKQMKKKCFPSYFHKEVMQHWIDPKGEVRTMSLSTNSFSQTYDAWQYYTTLEIRPKDFQNSPKYRISPYRIYPKMTIQPALKRNGFKSAFYAIAPQVLLSALLKDSCAETLLKSGRNHWLRYYLQSPNEQIRRNWQALKLCIRNNYDITDLGMWEDYLELLRGFKKDLNSPLYSCPENLKQAHDRLVEKKKQWQRKTYLLKMRAEIQQAQRIYAQEKKRFFGLCFKEAAITNSVLENVSQFMHEGDSLKHCVFTNEYFKRKDSLLLGATIENKPVETIEVSLSIMEITQCRGMKNNESIHHKMILDLMSKNLCQIRARMKKEKPKKT